MTTELTPACSLKNVYLVTLGTVIGHTACTSLAVIAGRYISTKISVKHGLYSSYIFPSIFLIYIPQLLSEELRFS